MSDHHQPALPLDLTTGNVYDVTARIAARRDLQATLGTADLEDAKLAAVRALVEHVRRRREQYKPTETIHPTGDRL